MSADNGIYILKTVAKARNGFEFRIAEMQAVERLYEPDNREVLLEVFGKSEVFLDSTMAWIQAGRLYEKVVSNGYYIEYGVSVVSLDKPFPGRRRRRRNRRYHAS